MVISWSIGIAIEEGCNCTYRALCLSNHSGVLSNSAYSFFLCGNLPGQQFRYRKTTGDLSVCKKVGEIIDHMLMAFGHKTRCSGAQTSLKTHRSWAVTTQQSETYLPKPTWGRKKERTQVRRKTRMKNQWAIASQLHKRTTTRETMEPPWYHSSQPATKQTICATLPFNP
jgi:hypothetical protein